MDDETKNKKIRKFINKSNIKGIYKKVDNLEECDMVFMINIKKLSKKKFTTKENFIEDILPDPDWDLDDYGLVYLKHSNPRNKSNNLPHRLHYVSKRRFR